MKFDRSSTNILPPDVVPGLGDLQEEVRCIEAAKRGGVVVKTACVVKFALECDLTEADRAFIMSTTSFAPGGGALAAVLEGYETRFVPLDHLAPEDADDLLETLEFHVSDGMGPYVIDDSERARRALGERLGEG